jgi:hypothetical protein
MTASHGSSAVLVGGVRYSGLHRIGNVMADQTSDRLSDVIDSCLVNILESLSQPVMTYRYEGFLCFLEEFYLDLSLI